MNKCLKNSGIILVTVIAAMSLLTVFALSAGSLTSTTMRYAQKELSRTRAMASALAGVNYTIHMITTHPADVDSLWQSAVKVDSKEQANNYFYHVELDKEAWFDVIITDETRKININALNEQNVSLLVGLLKQNGVSKTLSDQIAANVLAWAKDKKAPFDDVTEVLLATGMTREIFELISNDLTIYPKDPQEGLKINYFTASEKLFKALVEDLTGSGRVENVGTIIGIAEKYRVQDRPIICDPIEIAMMSPAGHVSNSTWYLAKVSGYDAQFKTRVSLKAFISKDQEGAWHVERVDREYNE